MKDEACQIMLEHLKTLQEVTEDCDPELLLPITTAMVTTAQFLVNQDKDCTKTDCEE